MNLRRTFTALGLMLVSVPAFAKDDAASRTQLLLDTFKSVHTAPEGESLSQADRDKNDVAYKTLDDFFDYERLSGEPIAPNKKLFTADQLARYNKTLQSLIRMVAYPRGGTFLKGQQIAIGKPKVEGKKADVNVHAAVPEEDMEHDVLFHWQDQGTAWRIVDVSFDGSSLTKDYQNQFTRIIKKDGVDALLKKLSSRLDEETRGIKGS